MDVKTLFGMVKDITAETFENYVDEIVDVRSREVGIEKTVSSLLDAGADFDTSIRIIMNHWDLSLKEATEYVRIDMVEVYPYRRFIEYYVKEGYEEDRIYKFWSSCNIKNKLRECPELAKKNPADLYQAMSKEFGITL